MQLPSAALVLTLLASPVAAATVEATVDRVIDGDTVDADGQRYRLIGLDAPESDQEHGRQARSALEQFVLGRTVEITSTKRDRYGRGLAIIRLGETDINAEMVRLGHAWNDPIYPPRNRYIAEEREAVCSRRGLWAESALPPWQYRDC